MRRISIILGLIALSCSIFAANKVTTVNQVSEPVTLMDNIDYVISSTTPFAEGGMVNITNTDHAVLILQNIKPSAVLASWLGKYVQINGEKAVNNSNCQVKMYAQGAIIMPYGKNFRPLTVYSEKKFQGESVNSFGLENTGGFMNTLTDAKLNNRIHSFKLKRGYMVTFSTRAGGRGYSRCFIADKEDLEVSELPTVLDGTISSYRVFQWYDAEKKSLANNTSAEANAALQVTSCYSFGPGETRLPDQECIPHHIHEGWPAPSALGSCTYSCHMKTNNEPGNSADPDPCSVEDVLRNWEELMRTGMRLCSESSHDGSWNHLRAFIDSIDARGWRCDILDLHCYWASGFNNMQSYYNNYGKRPIWISEWVWGASWNNNGVFASNHRTQESNVAELKNILPVLNASPYVERYFYWNDEQDFSKIYKDGKLTLSGEYYASVKSGLAYDRTYEKIPNNPRSYAPGNLSASFDKNTRKVLLEWNERNGEYNKEMKIQCKRGGTYVWTNFMTVDLQEAEADYSFEVDAVDGDMFRIRVVDVNGTTLYSNEATAINPDLQYGDGVTVVKGGEAMTKYLGGNQLINGDFELGLYDWTNGAGNALSAPNFQAVPEGGVDGSAYLQCYGGESSTTGAQSIRRVIDVEPGACYFSAGSGSHNNSGSQHFALSTDGNRESRVLIKFDGTNEWAKFSSAFAVNTETQFLIQLHNLDGVAQFDNLMFCQLFDTPEEAMSDALIHEKKRIDAVIAFNSQFPELNEYLQASVAKGNDANLLEEDVKWVLAQIKHRNDSLQKAIRRTDFEKRIPFEADANHYQLLTSYVSNPNFSSASGWTTACGTYTKGDQRLATQAGKTCWNAWWSLSSAGNENQTLAIKQTIANLSHGLYALECKATTEHLCENDQHAYLKVLETGETVESTYLPYGNLDLPIFSDAEKWHQLTTSYLYVGDKGKVEIGFVGSKQGVKDKQWKRYGSPLNEGDNREGWWCATDFNLRYIPMSIVEMPDKSGWTTICMKRAVSAAPSVKFYRVAGILANGTGVCMEEVTTTKAGYPYVVCNADTSSLYLFESGADAVSAKTDNGYKGNFEVNSLDTYSEGGIRLVNGEWEVVTSDKIQMGPFSAYISRPSRVSVLQSWEGLIMPLKGYTSLHNIGSEQDVEEGCLFNLSGQQMTEAQGLVIRQGKVIFVK